jgi:hypothetical protein
MMKNQFLLAVPFLLVSAFSAFADPDCSKIDLSGVWEMPGTQFMYHTVTVTFEPNGKSYCESDAASFSTMGPNEIAEVDFDTTFQMAACTFVRIRRPDTSSFQTIIFGASGTIYTKVLAIKADELTAVDCVDEKCADPDFTKSYHLTRKTP